MMWYFVGTFLGALLFQVLFFRKILSREPGLMFILFATSIAFGSITVIFVQPELFLSQGSGIGTSTEAAGKTTSKVLAARASVNINSSLLFNLNIALMFFSFLMWFMTRPTVDQQRKNFLIDIVGAWNKMDIDNSTEDLVSHALKNKEDRQWAKEVLMILKNYQPNQDYTGHTYEPKSLPRRLGADPLSNETGEKGITHSRD